MKGNALLAKALYDNHPDCSEELAFCKGDILTILEQNVPESEGWWKCGLHGRRGLAPANRLQILAEAPADRPCPHFPRIPEETLSSSEEAYQVPSLLSPPPPGPIYEHMKSWVEVPLPSMAQVYEFPDPSANAKIICEKTLSFPKQALFTLPRPARASLPPLSCQVYDIPAQSRVASTFEVPEKQQLYDIPGSPQKAGLSPPLGQAHSVPSTLPIIRNGGYNTLPNPQKSEWIYDTPVSPEKASVRNASLTSFVHVPTSTSTFHTPPNSKAGCPDQQLYKDEPQQKKLSLPEIPGYGFSAPRDIFPLVERVSYKVPSSFLMPHMEQQNTEPNTYDIPKATSSAPQTVKKLEKANGAAEIRKDHSSTWFSRRVTPVSPEPDRLSISSSDGRASIISSGSSTSTDSSSSSSSEELAKELSLDLDMAKEMVMALQQKVVSSVAGLMLFVNRKWRFRESLEANLDAIHQASDHIEESLREFLDFARGVSGAARNLTDSHLQARIRGQLQLLSNSYQTLLETKGSLNGCSWALEVLVTDKVQSTPDDLERFVMVARMVPEDTKKFASIVIANGRLLFKQNSEKEETEPLTPNAEFNSEKCIQLPQREPESFQRSAPFNEQRENEQSPELLKKNRTNVCGQKLYNLEEKKKPSLEQRAEKNKDLGTKNPNSLAPQPLSRQNPEKKVHLSEHCRLYFGALFKAISVFSGSLGSNQPPETIIRQSKLVIMVGQKLVDVLCKETQERDVRNEILCSSSHLCGLLRNLALATKDAVLQYPSPEALRRLQAETEKLEQHARQFRAEVLAPVAMVTPSLYSKRRSLSSMLMSAT